MPDAGVLALFAEPAAAAAAIRALRAAGYRDIHAAMPAPFPEVMEALHQRQSNVGASVFFSTLFGVAAGFAFCAWTSLAWPLVVGGKPIVAWPTFTVVAFELAVLFGGSVTHAVLAFNTATGRWRKGALLKDARFSNDRIGVFAVGGDAAAVELLEKSGGEEVRRVA